MAPRNSSLDLLSQEDVIRADRLEACGRPKMTQEEFVAQAGHSCPFCGSREVTGGGLAKIVGPLIQAVWGCDTCDSEWVASYQLSGYDPGQAPDAETQA